MDGLDGRKVALYGDVRIQDPLRMPVGDCLWHREIVKVGEGRSRRTVSDVSQMAGFSLVVEGREFRVADLPTEVHGGNSSSGIDDFEWSQVLSGGRERYRNLWLPVVNQLTVVGQIRRTGNRWEIAKDPVAGMLFTSEHPARTALREYVKGGLGLAAAVAALALVIWGVRLVM